MDRDGARWIKMEQDEARCEIRPDEVDLTLIRGYGWIKMDQDGARWTKMDQDGMLDQCLVFLLLL